MPFLRVWWAGEQRDVEVTDSMIIGRDESCDFVLADPMVSRKHASIRRDANGEYVLTDLGSRHGTFAEGERVTTVRLTEHCEVLLGRTKLYFSAEEEGATTDLIPTPTNGQTVAQRMKLEAEPRFRRGSEIPDVDGLRRDYEKLRYAYELSRAIMLEHDLRALLERITDTAIKLTGADRGELVLLDENTGGTSQHVARTANGSSTSPVLSRTIMREAIATRAALLCTNPKDDLRFSGSHSVYGQQIRSAMCIPLLDQHEVLGVLQVDMVNAVGVFRPRDLELCSILAAQAALAIKSLMLRERLAEITREQEARANHAERLALVGQLAGGIAHDFNNILNVILSYAGFIQETARPDQVEELKVIRQSGLRAAALVRQLLDFSRREMPPPSLLQLDDVIREMEMMLRPMAGSHIELEIDLGAGDTEVLSDQGRLEQVVMNLAVNARDAMPDGGKLTIRTRRIGDKVELRVTDTGCGMTPEVAARIFEPYFTTKPSGRGTGLGLATVFGIVDQAGGTIKVESAVGAGSTFSVLLPVAGEDISVVVHAA